MTVARTRVFAGTYLDSVQLLGVGRAMQDAGEVSWATAMMATPGNIEVLGTEGFASDDLGEAGASDLVLAVRANTAEAAEAALDAGERLLAGARPEQPRQPAERPGRTMGEAVSHAPSANVAVISVPGPYAALEAHHALTAGLHVLLFSDNVPLEEEVELKERAERLGRLLMGPGAGTAVLGGAGLGFANVVGAGQVGVVAAAGTGAQEVMSLLDRWGVGLSHVIGVGGRDLSAAVGGRMSRLAVRELDADPGTRAVLLVSKPPDAQVARAVTAECTRTPMVAALVGLTEWPDRPAGLGLATTLEEGAAAVAERLGVTVPSLTEGLRRQAGEAAAGLAPTRTAVRGYFSGGTLCSEAQMILGRHLGPVHSNIPLEGGRGLPAPEGAHVCLDLGEEEYTRGRPHPMIDPTGRIELLRTRARDADVAVVLLDIVLGHGAHPDPAGVLAPAVAELTAGDGPRVVAYVLGTRGDPQDYSAQRKKLEDVGCVVPPTAARAAHLAAAIAARKPELAEAFP